MIIRDIQSESAHWYTRDGKSAHTVPNKSKPGTYRPTTIRDARGPNGLLPSVTSILSIIAKPTLVDWRINQAILAALTLPRERGEIDDAFAIRVVQDSKAQAREAAEKGSMIHEIAEHYLTYGSVDCPPEMRELFQPLKDWFDENIANVYSAEKVLVNTSFEYAGTCDLHCEIKGVGPCVLDMKGQKYREDKGVFAPLLHDEYPLQLIAYAECIEPLSSSNGRGLQLVSLPFCYEKPTAITHKLWPIEQNPEYWKAFLAAMTLWKYIKKW